MAKLWRVSRDTEIAEAKLRLPYARILRKVSDLFYYRANDLYETTGVLRRAYQFAADEKPDDVSMPALQENAAFMLGRYFERATPRAGACIMAVNSLSNRSGSNLDDRDRDLLTAFRLFRTLKSRQGSAFHIPTIRPTHG